MSINDHHLQVVAEKPVSDYAPKRNGELYLTDAMIAPEGNMNMGDPLRLTQMAGPALDQIGKATADKIELSAQTLVENARHGAETILAEAHAHATDMISSAETQAADMRELARAIRTHTDRKAAQVASFCSFAESIITTMHGLGSNFQSIIVAEQEAEKEDDKLLPNSLSFLTRSKAK